MDCLQDGLQRICHFVVYCCNLWELPTEYYVSLYISRINIQMVQLGTRRTVHAPLQTDIPQNALRMKYNLDGETYYFIGLKFTD